MSISVSLTRTACHFGGYRHWFSCPNCSKRVGALYLEGTTPLCRKCSDIVYVSKNSSEIDQISNKINKLANYIYEDYFNGLGYKKKKGMHWITFERLSNKLLKLKQIRDRLIMDRLGLEL